ncbi:hypothetical protein EV122DRAFT_254021 [Schizophyllum commune]|nr:hypothetical protein K523DRAFT_334329 [Schizophyllum commune Tattone D]
MFASPSFPAIVYGAVEEGIWPLSQEPLAEASDLTIAPNTCLKHVLIDAGVSVMYLTDESGYPADRDTVIHYYLEVRGPAVPTGGEVLPVGRARGPGYPIFQLFYLYTGNHYQLSTRSSAEMKWDYGGAHGAMSLSIVWL